MGKKGNWISAIKSLFTSNSNSNSKPTNNVKSVEKKKKKKKSFFTREPSSIEKILGEIDQQLFTSTIQQQQPSSSSSTTINNNNNNPPIPVPVVVSPSPPRPATEFKNELPLQKHQLSATTIQAAYRAYTARKKFKGLRAGIVRLQSVIRGQHVRRQTVNAMKQMQRLVRIQTQIQSSRIHNLQQSLAKPQWDDDRLIRKVIKREERDIAYAYANSHKLWNQYYPWWWKRLDDQLQSPNPQESNDTTTMTPMSSKSMVPARTRRHSKPTSVASSSSSYPIKDDDSLMSCPAFSSVPNYMSPTFSAKAKAKPKPRPTTSQSSKRLFSLPSTPKSASSFSWNKKSPASVGNFSINSSSSSVGIGGRKPFNRFV